MDRSVFYLINQWPESLAPFFKFLSQAIDLTPVRIVLLAGILFFAFRRQTRKGTLIAGFGWILTELITNRLKHTIAFGRPCNDGLANVIERIGCSDSMGTASAHAANMAFVATVLTFYFRAWGSPWIVLAVLVGISRVYVGAHYPSQVLLGWAIGILVALGLCALIEWINRRRKGATEERPEEPSNLHDPASPAAAPLP